MPQLNPKPPKTARSPDDAPNPPCSESSRARCRSRACTARSRRSEAAHDRWACGSVLTQLGCSVLRETSLHRRKRRCILVVVYISQDSETYPAYRVDTKRAFRARPGPCDSGSRGRCSRRNAYRFTTSRPIRASRPERIRRSSNAAHRGCLGVNAKADAGISRMCRLRAVLYCKKSRSRHSAPAVSSDPRLEHRPVDYRI